VKHPADAAKNLNVLVVEDDDLTREALMRLLTRLGYQPCAAGSVTECFEKLNGQPWAVLDLNLPDGLGTQIIARMRREKQAIRIAVVSGTEDLELLADAKRCGADLVLRKPLNVSLLVEWMEAPPA
jgi:DNA-binding response OmpR family regulator